MSQTSKDRTAKRENFTSNPIISSAGRCGQLLKFTLELKPEEALQNADKREAVSI